MKNVAVIAYASAHTPASEPPRDETELLVEAINSAIAASGIPRKDIGFTVSGSCDFLGGRPFSFVSAVDAIGAWPPISESHVEMDGAFALYEAWVRLQAGDVDVALVYAFGRATQGDLPRVMAMQLDPYYVLPLGVDANDLAGLQQRALFHAGRGSETAPTAAPPADAAAAIVLASGERALRAKQRAWIRGIDQRIEPHALGSRDLTRSVSTKLAAEKAGALNSAIDVACLHTTYSHHEAVLVDALGLSAKTRVETSMAADPTMTSGLMRIGDAARHVWNGSARTLAHAQSGPCLQQNLICLLEGDAR